ncbi:type II toxin-antitoxin system RelE/ParE family toxin [Lactococcus garvieae]|uniref:type II toxin-antitoxin system RelE/ParE family toxin n=1 Tax=Lactococcus garvieae TaxID=1363 RepID=UPI000AB759D4|nr:type II toxin-antitoxin system RelE/ParE family toxin [Lactococcus garvieae]MDG6192354.1 type II toxin-antitoxin system RelE/ParE family toxin [Lactococcus garvieae]
MSNYNVTVPEQVLRDMREAIFYKKELETYQENLKKFQTELTEFMDILKTSPKIGSNLSVRIGIETNVKYRVIEDYIMFYEILGSEVYVLRVLPAKSNWMNTILKQI